MGLNLMECDEVCNFREIFFLCNTDTAILLVSSSSINISNTAVVVF